MVRKLLCCLLALLLITGVQVQGATTAELQQQIDALEEQKAQVDEQLKALEEQLTGNSEEIEAIIANKNVLDQQIFLLNESLAAMEAQLANHAGLIADKQEELDLALQNQEQLQADYRLRIRAMEENGSISYWEVLFEASSFSDLLDRLAMIEEINKADRMRLEELRTAAQKVEQARTALLTEKSLLEQTRQEQQQALGMLDAKREEANGLLRDLVATGQEYEELLHQAELLQDALMQQLVQKENEYDQAAREEWEQTHQPTVTPGGTKPDNGAAVWLTPVPYYTLSSPFGMRFHPILNVWRMHNGVDMACGEGTPIYASRSGVVSVAAYQADGAGNYVQLNHGDGYCSIYMHMTHYIVKPGQRVQAGQIIGYVGSTGLSKGNHLHFGISYNGTYVNPMDFLQ